MTQERPNILWICTDQQRWDTVRALGNEHIDTPNLDRLCAEGVAFEAAYCQNPVCAPSRASFLTGLYPSATGVNRNGLPEYPDLPRTKLITTALAEAGYDCGLAGKLHLAAAQHGEEARVNDGYRRLWYSHSPFQGYRHGNQYLDWLEESGRFDEAFTPPDPPRQWDPKARYEMPPELHQTTWCTDRAIEFMDEARLGPWLMSVNPFDPHGPFDPPAEYDRRYRPEDVPAPLFRESDLAQQAALGDIYFQTRARRPDEREQSAKAKYYAMIELIDHNVGRLLDALEQRGLRESTIVIFTSDHGEMLGDHGLIQKGCRFYEGAVRVPLIVSWPGHWQAGLRYPELVELTDLTATLVEATGVHLPRLHGRSLGPVLRGETTAPVRDYVRCEYYYAMDMRWGQPGPQPDNAAWGSMYRDRRHKLVTYHGHGVGELYDLQQDPHEFRNLWDDPAHAATKCELLRRAFDATVLTTDLGPPLSGRF